MRTILLDRDGVINENRSDHVKSWHEFRFLPGALDALRLLTLSEFRIFVVTNQAIINRGITPRAVVDDIHHRMTFVAHEHGAVISDVAYCPHRTDERCACRKPRPGLLLDLARRWRFDVRETYLIGDALSDIAAGQSVGSRSILVQTGRGRDQAQLPEAAMYRPAHIALDLPRAVQWILEQEGLTFTAIETLFTERVVVTSTG